MTNNDIRRNYSEGFVHSFPRMFNALQPSRAWGVDREIYAMLMTRLSTRGFNPNVREESLPFRLSRAKPQTVLGVLATRDSEEIARIEPGLEDFLIHYPIVTPINTSNVAPIFADVLGTTLQTWTSSNERCICDERRKPGQTKADYRGRYPTYVPQVMVLAFDRPITCGICEKSKAPCSTFMACLKCKRMVCA